MNFLDILIAIPLLYFIYKGWKRGLIFELATLVGIIAGCYAATHFSAWVADVLKLDGEGAILIAFFITFVGVVVLAVVLGKAVEGFVKLVKVGKANNVLGAALGMLKSLVVVSVLINLLLMVDPTSKIITQKTREGSLLFKPTHTVGNRLTAHLKQVIAERKTAEE
ncbi:MAG: CvpA family protein [Bacteroidales bacterium]|nr:CvpA family protein [Bacteroidales bacterium]